MVPLGFVECLRFQYPKFQNQEISKTHLQVFIWQILRQTVSNNAALCGVHVLANLYNSLTRIYRYMIVWIVLLVTPMMHIWTLGTDNEMIRNQNVEDHASEREVSEYGQEQFCTQPFCSKDDQTTVNWLKSEVKLIANNYYLPTSFKYEK